MPSFSDSAERIWLAVHAWYHPASEIDAYRKGVAESLRSVGVPFGILRGRSIPSGPVSQAILPLILRNSMTYGNVDGLVHDLYGDSVFRNVGVSTIQDLYWNSHQDGLTARSLQLAMRAYQAYRRTLVRSKRIIATTPFLRDELLKTFGHRFQEKIRIVPLACQPDETTPARPKVYDVIWVGTTLRRKAPTEFLRAVGSLPREFRIAIRLRPASKLLSESSEEITKLVDQYRREGRKIDVLTQELPWTSMGQLYSASKCLVSTSTYEGFHAPVLEAYLRGVSVVLPDAPFYRSIYDGVETGIHWYTGSQALPRAIAEGVQSGPFNVSSALRSRFSFRTVGSALKALYEEVSRR